MQRDGEAAFTVSHVNDIQHGHRRRQVLVTTWKQLHKSVTVSSEYHNWRLHAAVLYRPLLAAYTVSRTTAQAHSLGKSFMNSLNAYFVLFSNVSLS